MSKRQAQTIHESVHSVACKTNIQEVDDIENLGKCSIVSRKYCIKDRSHLVQVPLPVYVSVNDMCNIMEMGFEINTTKK